MIAIVISLTFIIMTGICWWAIEILLSISPTAKPLKSMLYVHAMIILVSILILFWIIWQLLIASGVAEATFT
jgi:hypothetical protein